VDHHVLARDHGLEVVVDNILGLGELLAAAHIESRVVHEQLVVLVHFCGTNVSRVKLSDEQPEERFVLGLLGGALLEELGGIEVEL